MKQRVLHIVIVLIGLALLSCGSVKKAAKTEAQVKPTSNSTELTEKDRMRSAELFF